MADTYRRHEFADFGSIQREPSRETRAVPPKKHTVRNMLAALGLAVGSGAVGAVIANPELRSTVAGTVHGNEAGNAASGVASSEAPSRPHLPPGYLDSEGWPNMRSIMAAIHENPPTVWGMPITDPEELAAVSAHPDSYGVVNINRHVIALGPIDENVPNKIWVHRRPPNV